jgi:hypothetical protein
MNAEVTTIEVVFFAAAVLLPLVGGGAILYFLSKGSRAQDSKKK